MNSRLATILSVILHPLIITTYLFGFLFFTAPSLVGVGALGTSSLLGLLLLLFINTFVAPTAVILYMYRFGIITSLHVENLLERRWPYLITVIIYGISTYLFGWQFQPISNLAPQIALILGCVTVSLLVVALVSLFWKISAHATGMGGAMGIVGAFYIQYNDPIFYWALLIVILITGLLLSARLRLNAHNLKQIFAGFLTGLVIGIATIFLFF